MAKNETHIKSTPASRWWEYKKKNFIPTGSIVIGFIFLLIGIAFFPLAILGLVMIGWGVYKIFKNWGEYKKKRDKFRD